MAGDEAGRGYADDDAVLAALGIEVLEVAPGRAVVALTVTDDHTDHRGLLSRGVAFTVADTAIALASNAYGPVALLVHADTEWVADVAPGGRLIATCLVDHRSAGAASFVSRLTTGDDDLVGVVRGSTRSPRR